MKSYLRLSMGLGIVLALQACAPSNYVVQSPTPSAVRFEAASKPAAKNLQFNDARAETEKVFSYGILKAGLLLDDKDLDPIAYLEEHTPKELAARGLNASSSATGDVRIDVKKFNMRNHRTNGYTPFITFTMLSADVSSPSGTERVVVFIKRGKTPVWSFDEIVQPTLNEPLDLLVKEFSAKLNSRLFGAKMSDSEVQKLADKIKSAPATDATYLDVYQLGFSNNARAVPTLVELSQHESEYVRLAAISSLGTLRAGDQLEHLQGIYKTSGIWQDRGMALKAIGDIGTPPAMAFLQQAHQELESAKEREQVWSREIIELYTK